MGVVRFKVLLAEDDARIAASRDALGGNDFDEVWAKGSALSIQEAIAYAQRGRSERKRASSGWASPTRTVQAHLTHIYTKLGLTSRVQLAQQAARPG